MELRELKYFLAVAREESISKAAKSLFITQPNLSRQMQNLEKEIGQPLCLIDEYDRIAYITGTKHGARALEILTPHEMFEEKEKNNK